MEETPSTDYLNICNDNSPVINPAAGLPMLDDSKVDVAGNPVVNSDNKCTTLD
tara:strand:+ start:769 stop:927 length:159 start_codon:yes stop_codon:yes gene_type:complete